ncbi:hypothetical protein [Bacillus testis]|uniref:hypothetical protein n=1 Tax=Bacillus testis TaxID=1622072 RepID=UPI00067EA527|nr:hypothetical protein [Bacillus testis]
MGIFNELGKGLGGLAGIVIGSPIKFIGEVTEIKMLENIGNGVKHSSKFAGEALGTFTDGALGTVSGLINDDPSKRDQGLSEMGTAVGQTAKGVYNSAKNVLKNSGDIIVGAIEGDMDSVKKGAAGIVTTVAVGALAVGVIDIVDGVDVSDVDVAETDATDYNVAQASVLETGVVGVEDINPNPDTHHVDSHYVQAYDRSDGTHVDGYWRGGDTGYEQTNPDNTTLNNLNT